MKRLLLALLFAVTAFAQNTTLQKAPSTNQITSSPLVFGNGQTLRMASGSTLLMDAGATFTPAPGSTLVTTDGSYANPSWITSLAYSKITGVPSFGSVSSVGLSLPAVFSVTGSPVTTSGVLTATFATGQTANQVLASPNGSTGPLGLRALVAADIPTLTLAKISDAGTAAAKNVSFFQTPQTSAAGYGIVNGSVIDQWGTLTPPATDVFASGAASLFLATPSGSSGVPLKRAMVNGDVPTALTGKTYNGLTVTTSNGTLTIPNGTTLNTGTGGTLGSAAFTDAAGYQPLNATLTALSGKSTTGTGNVVLATSPIIAAPTLTTPVLGVATATSVNKVTITAPASSATLMIADGKTLTVSNNATVSGTNTGDQTIALTGDVTGSGVGTFATTLATVNTNVGTFGNNTSAVMATVNAKGLVTAISQSTITPAYTSVGGFPTGAVAGRSSALTGSLESLLVGNSLTVSPGVIDTVQDIRATATPTFATVTANLVGNSSTATALETARTINGVSFNGTTNITVPAAATTLTGTTLASNVVDSSLKTFGVAIATSNAGPQLTPVVTIAALKAVSVSALATSTAVNVLGYYAAGDGGGGIFRYSSASSATDNGGTVIQPTTGSGRWLRVYDGALNGLWFGMRGNGSDDNVAVLQNAVTAAAAGQLFIPAGTYILTPVADVLRIVVGSDTAIQGAGDSTVFKIANGGGNYGDLFSGGPIGQEGTYIQNVRFTDLKFDSNADNRPSVVIGNDSSYSTETWFHSSQCDNIQFVGCTFYWNGHQAIKVENEYLHSEDRRGLLVTGCEFYYHRNAIQAFFDNTAIYSQQKHTIISANKFWTDDYTTLGGVISGLIAIEVHHGPYIVTGNSIEWYYSGIYANSANTFTSSEQPFTGNVVQGNSITKCNTGIEMWGMPGKINRDLAVVGNTITVANLDWAQSSSAGVKMPQGSASNGDYDQILVADNVIRFQNEPTNRSNSQEAENGGIAICPFGSVRGLTLSHNMIYDAPGCGINIRPGTDSVGSNTISNVVLSGNLIVNAGQNGGISNTYRQAIRIRYRTSAVFIHDNFIIDTDNPFRGYGDFLIKDITAPVIGRNNQVFNQYGTYTTDISGTADWPTYQNVSPSASPTFVAVNATAVNVTKTTGTAQVKIQGASNAQNAELYLTEDGSSGATLRYAASSNAIEFRSGTSGAGGALIWQVDRDAQVQIFENYIRIGSTSGPIWRSGTGSPESVVAAPVGSMYSRTDGGATTSLYVKESGTGNTGWIAK